MHAATSAPASPRSSRWSATASLEPELPAALVLVLPFSGAAGLVLVVVTVDGVPAPNVEAPAALVSTVVVSVEPGEGKR